MKTLSIREARQALSQLDELLARHGEITITRRGEAVAKIVPLKAARPVPSHRDLRESMRPMKVPSEVLLRQDRDTR
jgi:antitoxin (DNA-binding transcriptional repressor) of toxin-antitoxin stability system